MEVQIDSMNKIKIVTLVSFLTVLIGLICYPMVIKNPDTSLNLYVRNDIEPIRNYFTMLDNIEKAYWISGNDNVISLGPTDIYIKGFILLNKKNFNDIIFSYDWMETNIIFDKNFQPTITGFSDFKWYYSDKFSNDLSGINFMGNAYIDKINFIIYFDFNTF